MSDVQRLNRHQLDFLRLLRNHPYGLPLEAWPRVSTWRRWLKRPRFRRAVRSLQVAFKWQTDLLLAGSAARAAMLMQTVLSGDGDSTQGINAQELEWHHEKLRSLSRVLREDVLRRAERRRQRRRGGPLPLPEDASGEGESAESPEQPEAPRYPVVPIDRTAASPLGDVALPREGHAMKMG